jgi:beta-lactamase class A
MAELLVRIASGTALGPKSTRFLLELMARDETGAGRLRGRLPPNVVVSSKSGTIQGTAENDVGIVTLPDGSRVAVAVYLTDAKAEPPALERVIADIGRAVYDFFAMEPRAKP